jgi:predicted phosphoadenosine phosphosulfate sulfurtransferase
MFRRFPTKSGCVTHQRGLGFSFRNLIGSLFTRAAMPRRKRINVADLPDDLCRDIGFGSDRHETSFEARWQKELKDLQR